MCILFAWCYGVHDLKFKKKTNSLRPAAVSVEIMDFKDDTV